MIPNKKWDAFVSHASEDKERFVRPLAEELRQSGFRIWLDDWELVVGSSLMQSIESGLRESHYGIVVLSPRFFGKRWPKNELAALFARESVEARVILPIWLDVTFADVARESPLLADRLAARAEEGIAGVAQRLIRALKLEPEQPTLQGFSDMVSHQSLRELTERLFPEAGVDEFWQTQLLADLDRAMFRSISDIELAVLRARPAVAVFAQERPDLFKKGTDYITKSLGFVDLRFRKQHNWARATLEAFDRLSSLVDWEAEPASSQARRTDR